MARAAGALAVLAVGVNVLGQVAALAGDFAQARALKAEADAVREATGTHVARYGALVLAALQGRPGEAYPLIDDTVTSATDEGQGTAAQYAHWAKSVILNAAGQYDEAYAVAVLASDDTPELFVSTWALSEQVEAAIASGNDRGAAEALGRLQERTRGTDKPWGLGLEARSRGLVAGGPGVEAAYREAVEQLRRTRLRPDLARPAFPEYADDRVAPAQGIRQALHQLASTTARSPVGQWAEVGAAQRSSVVVMRRSLITVRRGGGCRAAQL